MSLMDHYWTLASDNPDERIKAAEALLSGLIEQNSEKDWQYAFKRLLRGLASNRGSARLGFSMTLSELLEVRQNEIQISDYLNLCSKEFEISSNMKSNEQRGLQLGMLFALQILGKSPLWNSANDEDLINFAQQVIDLALKKTWLREPPFFALCDLLKKLCSKHQNESAIPEIFKLINNAGLSQTCEGVATALALPIELRLKYNIGWNSGDPLDSENLSQLSRVLYDLPVSSGDVSETKPYIHYVWSYLADEFAHIATGGATTSSTRNGTKSGSGAGVSAPPAKKKKTQTSSYCRVDLQTFWQTVVDNNFFSTSSSAERKLWGMEIFYLWIQNEQLHPIHVLFSANVIKTWSLHLAKQDKNLHRLSKRIANYVVDELPNKRNSELIEIISQFMKFSPNFDKISKFKLVSKLLSSVKSNDEISVLVSQLLSNLNGSTHHRQWVLDNLVHLVKNFSSFDGSKLWLNMIFDKLVPLAYFMHEQDDSKFAVVVQERLMSILAATLGTKSPGTQSSGQSTTNGVCDWPYTVVTKVIDLSPSLEFRIDFDDETSKIRSKAENTLKKIHKKRTSSKHSNTMQLQALELLFSMLLLQVYASVPDSIPMVEELQMCYKKMREHIKGADHGDEDNEDTSLVLTEIIISLLSQNSGILRKLSEDVWRLFADEISVNSLESLCDILNTSESKDGHSSLFSVDDDEDEDEEDSAQAEDDEAEAQAEAANREMEMESKMDEGEDEDDVSEESDDSASGSDASGDSGSDELDEQTKERLASTLGIADSSSDESMNDEEMSALDGHLAIIFRERKKMQTKAKEQRQQTKQAKQSIVQLKSRVLDLIDIYLFEQPENLNSLICLMPILNVVKTSKDRALSDKARELLRNRFCRKTTFNLQNNEHVELGFQLLSEVHLFAADSPSKVFSTACNQVSVFLVKLLLSFDKQLITRVSDVYKTSMENWYLNPKNKSTTGLFTDFVNFLNTKRV